MKKVMYNLGLVAILGLGVLVNAQTKEEGAVGINTETPQATLDIKTFDADGTSVEGVLIPRVSSDRAEKMGETVAEATLVYITDGTTGTGTTSLVNGKGFYYYDATAKKWHKVGGNDEAAKLQDLTGGIRKVPQANATEWAVEGTFCLIQTTTATIDMPDPANYKDKIFSVNNQAGTGLNYGGKFQPLGTTSLFGGKGHILMSDGANWYVIGGSY